MANQATTTYKVTGTQKAVSTFGTPFSAWR